MASAETLTSGKRAFRTPACCQCVVTRRPSSSPAAASMKAPVHTLHTRRAVPCRAGLMSDEGLQFKTGHGLPVPFAPDNDKRVKGPHRRERDSLDRHAGRRADQTSMPGQGCRLIPGVPQRAGNLKGRRHSGGVKQLEIGIKQEADPYGHVLK